MLYHCTINIQLFCSVYPAGIKKLAERKSRNIIAYFSRFSLNVCMQIAFHQYELVLMEWMQQHHNFVPPSSQEQTEPSTKMYDGKDLLSLPGDMPSMYGRNIARVLWSKEELKSLIMSPGKNLDYTRSPRLALSPKRKAIFRGYLKV